MAFLLIVGVGVSSARVSVQASVDRALVPLNSVVTYTITVSGENMGSVEPPDFPQTDDWLVQGTSSSQSTSIQIINGKVSASKTLEFIYYLVPQRTGDLEIPPVDVNVGGKTYKTNSIKVHVVKSTPSARRRAPSARSSRRSMPTPSAPSASQVPAGDKIFLTCTAYPETVYVGQQITVNFTLYSKLDVTNVSFEKDAEFKNCWVENIYEADRLSFRPTVLNGVRYYAMVLRKSAAFPLAPGKITIEPMELRCVVRYPPRSFFDWGREEEVKVRSNRKVIVVKDLPQAGKPPSFTGAVGQFSISSKVDRTQLPAGDVLTYTITVTGKGNIEALTLPEPQIPQDFDVYDRKERVNKKAYGDKWGGTKKLELYLVPRSEGKYVLPPVEFSYFDPEKKKYITVSTDSIVINVLKGKGTAVYAMGGKRGVVNVAQDIEYIKSDNVKIPVGKFEIRWGLKYLWFLLIDLVVILGAVAYRRRQEHLLENWQAVKASKALKTARRRLAEARGKKSLYEALGEISDAIFGYLADKFGLEQGAIIFDEVALKLEERGVPADVVQRLKRVLDDIDGARFAPSQYPIDLKRTVDETRDILEQIDRKLK